MSSFVALIRAANVGGTGKLPMTTLKAMCEEAGFGAVKTYIASGNVMFTSRLSERSVRAALESRLEQFAGRPVAAIVRTADEMTAVLRANPFKNEPPNSTVAIFLPAAPAPDALERSTGRSTERMALGAREIYVAYGQRMADTKLRIPGAEQGTARNLNTVAKLASMAAALGPPRSA